MRACIFVVAIASILQSGCGLSGLYAEIPPYGGSDEADAGADTSNLDADAEREIELLVAPTGLTATGAPDGVTLVWDEVEGAVGYEVRRDGGAWEGVGDVTTWLDTNAPSGTFDGSPIVTATDGHYGYAVLLEVTQTPTATDPPSADYEVRAVVGEAAAVSGARTLGEESWSWSVGPVGGELTVDPELTGLTPRYVADAPGRRFDFEATLTREGVDVPAESATVQGAGSKAIDVMTGESHVCVLLESGSVVCWGNRADGRLGDGLPLWKEEDGLPQYAPPVRVALPEPAKAIAGHLANTSCAIGISGAVYCWGLNKYGEVGDGSTLSTSQPSKVEGLPHGMPSFVFVSPFVSCSAFADSMRCWGGTVLGVWPVSLNLYESLAYSTDDGVCGVISGDGVSCFFYEGNEPIEYSDPIRTVDLGQSEQITPVDFRTGALEDSGPDLCVCIADSVGDVYCRDKATCMEDGGSSEFWSRTIEGSAQYSAGVDHACGVNDFGLVYCWGQNDSGQLGLGNTEDSFNSERLVSSLPSGMTTVKASSNFTCGMNQTGIVKCWGLNRGASLGCGVLGMCSDAMRVRLRPEVSEIA